MAIYRMAMYRMAIYRMAIYRMAVIGIYDHYILKVIKAESLIKMKKRQNGTGTTAPVPFSTCIYHRHLSPIFITGIYHLHLSPVFITGIYRLH